jgi:hypothetical protein
MSNRTASAPLVVWNRSIAAPSSVASPRGALVVKTASGMTWKVALAPVWVALMVWSVLQTARMSADGFPSGSAHGLASTPRVVFHPAMKS